MRFPRYLDVKMIPTPDGKSGLWCSVRIKKWGIPFLMLKYLLVGRA